MGVNICECDKRTEKLEKELYVDWDKKNSQTNNENIITINRNNNIIDDKSISRMKYIKMFNENGNSPLSNIKQVRSSTLSNNNNTSNLTLKDEKIQNIVKIQSCFRAYLVRKTNINKNVNKSDINSNNIEEIFEEEESISYRKNIDVTAVIYSNNNSEISQDNSSKSRKNNGSNLVFPFNIKNIKFIIIF